MVFFPCDTKEVISGSRDCGSWGLKHLLDPCLKICINPIILQLAIRECVTVVPCIFLFKVDWLVSSDFSAESNLFYVEMVPY